MVDDRDLAKRLRASSRRHVLSDDVKTLHLAAVDVALGRSVVPVRTETAIPVRRRWMVASAVAAFIILPTTVASASTSALPGDYLYSTKLSVEQVIGLVDDDVRAEHRVAELQGVIERGDDPEAIITAQAAAAGELQSLADEHPLRPDFHRLVLGSGDSPYRLEHEVDWRRGEVFVSSLDDGNLLTISHTAAAFPADQYELTTTGDWHIAGVSGDWLVSDRPFDEAQGYATVFEIAVGEDGLSIVETGGLVSTSELAEPDPADAAAGNPSPSGNVADAARRSVATATSSSTTITAPITTTARPATTTATKPPTTITTTTTRPPTTKPPTTPTTTTPTTTTTEPPTTTTTQPPTTTTTTGGDDDD